MLTAFAAVVVGYWLWVRYELAPWTRDGRVRADIIQISPDVSGFVTDVRVVDNQKVRKGDVLFVIDQPRYSFALQQAEATAASDRAALAEAQREAARDHALGDLVASETVQQGDTRVDQARAALQLAEANARLARFNLQRTVVRAPVDGTVTNVELQPGNYFNVGHEGMALVDDDSLYVDGYFEETKTPYIHPGDPVEVRLMGERTSLRGHVLSVEAAIVDRERGPSPDQVVNVNPTFSWVRLAQRIPVRIRLDNSPAARLIVGRTATVVVLDPHHRSPLYRPFTWLGW